MFEFELLNSLYSLLTSPWVWLILIASVMYAGGNYIDEILLVKYEQGVGTLLIISTLFGGVIAAFFLILALATDTTLTIGTSLIMKGVAIGVLEALWVIPYLYATERSGAIIAGPLFQAVPVFALSFEFLMGNVPPAIQILGAIIIVAGGIVLSIEKEEQEHGNARNRVDWTTIAMMSISAILVALIYVLFRDAALESNIISIGFWAGFGTLLTGLIIYAFWTPYRKEFNQFCSQADYRAVAIQFGNEILDAGGAYLTNIAATLGPSVMVVTAFNATQPLAVGFLGALLAYFGFKGVSTERVQDGMWFQVSAGIILIAAGVIVLAFGSNG